MHSIICKKDPENGWWDKNCLWFAMRESDYENYEPEYPTGRGATPLEAVSDLLWRLDLEDDAPYCLKILDGGSNGQT